MTEHAWVKELPIIITVSDAENTIIEMNDRSAGYFEGDGGDLLIGSDVMACHPELARSKLQSMIDTEKTNVYSFEESGKKMLVYQMPWYVKGDYAGYVEMIMEIPDEIPHHAG